MVKKKACIFISGKGTNLKALIKNSNTYNFPISIEYIVSSTKEAKGLVFAHLYKIEFGIFNLKKKLEQEKLLRELKKRNIFLICLSGYMKVLSNAIVAFLWDSLRSERCSSFALIIASFWINFLDSSSISFFILDSSLRSILTVSDDLKYSGKIV